GDLTMPGDTVTKRFHDQVAALGDRTAMRGRGPEGWREITWNEFARAVRETALGLVALGVEPGDAVCILSSNRPEWHVADSATLCAGARSAPIYTTNSPHQVAYIAGHAEAKVIFVDTEEQFQKVDKVRPDLPALQHVVVTADYPESPDGFVLSLPSLRERGRALDAEQPGVYDQRWQSASPEDVATVVYTSGTTGPPKGAIYISKAVVEMRQAGEEPIEEMQHGLHEAEERMFHPLRVALGLDQCSYFVSGAAPINVEILKFFHAVGIPIAEVYGQTEGTGPTSLNPKDRIKIGTVGPPIPGVEVRIAEDGEILVRGGNVFAGYFKDQAATAEMLEGGWMHTGDVGALDGDGYLTLTDRKKDIIITASGKNVAPQE